MEHNKESWIDLRVDTDTGIETLRAHFDGYAYDPHWHDAYLIGVTEQGVQQFNCRRQKHTSLPGNTFLLEPGEIHDGDTSHVHGFTYRMLYLPIDWLSTQLYTLFEDKPDNFELQIATTLTDSRQLAVAVSQAFLALHLAENRMVREGSLDRMLELMTEHLSWRKNRSKTPITSRIAYQAQEVLHANLYRDINLQEVADTLGSDRFRLSRIFKSTFGLAPHAYLIQLRLVEARRLLKRDIPPVQVASDLCFSDQSHFGRWFKRSYQMTPSQYRQSCTNLPDQPNWFLR
jgi:AraC-like DNA-binding protein